MVALITGIEQIGLLDSDTRGNDNATARLLAYNSVKNVGCDLYLAPTERTRKGMLADNAQTEIEVLAADVTKSNDVEALVQAVMQQHGRIVIMVLNVGMTAPGDPGSMSEEVEWAT